MKCGSYCTLYRRNLRRFEVVLAKSQGHLKQASDDIDELAGRTHAPDEESAAESK